MLAAACSANGATGAKPDGGADAAPFDATSGDGDGVDAVIPADAASSSDGGRETPCGLPASIGMTCDPGAGDSLVLVLSRVVFSLPEDDSVPGLDVDQRISDGSDVETCFREDYTSPPPGPDAGVDNQLGMLLDNLSLTDSLDRAVVHEISAGDLVLLMVLEGMDDRANDPCVAASFYQGRFPDNGPIMEGQTLAPNQTVDVLTGRMTRPFYGRIEAGVLHMGAGSQKLPLPIPDNDRVAELTVIGSAFRLTLDGDRYRGVFGGALEVDPSLAALEPALEPEMRAGLRLLLESSSDILRRDGDCQCISLGASVEAVPAELGARVAP